MPKASSSSRASQPQQDSLRLAQLVQRPVTDAAAAEELINAIDETLTAPKFKELAAAGTGKKSAAQSYVTAALQCAGWLVASRRAHVPCQPDFCRALGKCMVCTTTLLSKIQPVDPALLQCVLTPSRGSQVPGLTTWVPLAAEELMVIAAAAPGTLAAAPPADAGAAAAPSRHQKAWAALEEGLVSMVEEFFALWFRAGRVSYSSNSSSSKRSRALAAPTDWLHASFLQLVDKLLQKQLLHVAPGVVMHAMVAGVSVGAANPMVHPQLAAAAGQAPDPALAAQVSAALQQGCWWRALATCIAGVSGTLEAQTAAALTPPNLPQHPSRYCLPYHVEQAYPGQVTEGVPSGALIATNSIALHVLLVAELWEVWPWQLAQLAAAAKEDDGAGAFLKRLAGQAHSSGAASSSSGASGAGDNGGGSGAGDTQVKDQTATATTSSSGGSSGSGSGSSEAGRPEPPAASLLGSSRLPPDPSAWSMLLRVSGMEWPFLPDRAPSSAQQQQQQGQQQQEEGQGPPPVTLQQLQLTVSALSNCAAEGAVSAALLLALLLQRADPGVRAAFMGGPGGTALLAAAQYWGYSPGLNLATGTLPFTLLVPVELSKQSAARQLLAVLRRDSKGKAPDWALAGPLDSLGLLLAWCYLVPAGGWAAGLPHEWGPVPHQLHLVMTVHHFLSLERQEFCMPECLALRALPSDAFQFAPGAAPTPLLLGTLEALLRRLAWKVDPSTLLVCVAAFVHATVVWVSAAAGSGDAAPEAQTAAAQADGNSSSSSSSSSSHGGGDGNQGPSCEVADCPISPDVEEASTSSSSQHNTVHNSSPDSSSSSSSDPPPADSGCGDVLGSLASLAVTLCALLRQWGCAVNKRGADLPGLQFLAWNALPPCCLVAAKLLQLAAQQLALPGPAALPALQLAGAAQRLARVCAELAEAVIPALLQSGEPALGAVMVCLDPLLEMLLAGLVALQKVQPPWQQGTAEQGAAEQGAAEQGTAEQGDVENGATEQGGVDQVAMEQGTTENGAAEQGAGEQGATQQAAAESGTAEQAAAEQGAAELGTGEQAPAEMGAVGQEGGQPDDTAEEPASGGVPSSASASSTSAAGNSAAGNSSSASASSTSGAASGSSTRKSRRRRENYMKFAGISPAPTTSSSSSSSPQQIVYMHCMNLLLSTAQKILCRCNTQLQLVGCSNPCCMNLSGPSAEGLVAGRKKMKVGGKCGRCQVARYCSIICRFQDWQQHRHVCRRLAAAGAAAGVTAGAGPPQQQQG